MLNLPLNQRQKLNLNKRNNKLKKLNHKRKIDNHKNEYNSNLVI